MAILETKHATHAFHDALIAHQPPPMLNDIYTLYMSLADLNAFMPVLDQMSQKRPPNYILVPDNVPARFANQATRGRLELLSENLPLIHNLTTGRVMIKLLDNTVEELIQQYARLYQ